MRAAPFDPTNLDHLIAVLDSMHQHRLASPLNQSDALYYQLLANYYRDIRDAPKLGKKLVYHTAILPTEIFYAMDVVPAVLEAVSDALTNLCNLWEDNLATAKAYGLAPEVCSQHRLMVANALDGQLPRPDAVIWSNFGCDNTAKSGDLLVRVWDCPGYYLDHSYFTNERELTYCTRELEDMVAFLEDLTGRKLDWDRLEQAVAYGREMMELQREVEELRKSTPAPLRSRSGMFSHLVSFYFMGTPEAVTFFRQLRDEAKARVAKGEGFIKEEKYRLLMFFEPPVYGWKLLDWMERAHGAQIVFEPAFGQWGAGDYGRSKPLETLAYKTFLRPTYRQFQGPIEPLVEDMLKGAREYNVDGVISFCHVGCRQSSSCNRLLKDKIMDETGLPFFVVEHDMTDPAFASEEEMRDKIESFLEMIDERRR